MSALAAAAAMPAQAASLSQTYSCLYPLISSQPLSVDIDAAIPSSATVGVPTGEFTITADSLTNDTTWDGLNLVQAKTIEGTANATSSVTLPGGFVLPLSVPVNVPVTPVPATRGPINIIATGNTPSLTFTSPGQAPITVDAINLNLRAKKADGTSVIFPPTPGVPDSDGLAETFDVPCTLSPAGQNKLLATIDILPDNPVDTEPPTAPGIPTIENIGDVTPTTAKISWAASDDNVGVEEYEIRYDDVTVIVPGDETSTTLTGLLPDSEYFVTIVARDAAGNESDPSEEGQIITLPETSDAPPSKPAGLAGTPTTTTVALSWTASTDDNGVTGYDVYKDGVKVSTVSGTSTTISGLTPTTAYKFKVQAKDTAGQNSEFSDEITVTTLTPPDAPPSAPTNLVGTPQSTSVGLTWTAATDDKGISGYDVYKDGVKVSTVTGTTASVTGLTPETEYKFKVQAKDTKPQTGPFSTEITVKTLAASGGTVKYGYNVLGKSEIKTLTKGAVNLKGTFDAELTLATGAFTGDMVLNSTRARLQALGFIPITADLGFVFTSPTTGKLEGGVATATARFKVRLPKVYLFGSIPIAGGSTCQTKTSSVANLKSVGTFAPLTGGRLTGTYSLSDLTGCGALTGLVSPLTKGSGNTIDVTLTAK